MVFYIVVLYIVLRENILFMLTFSWKTWANAQDKIPATGQRNYSIQDNLGEPVGLSGVSQRSWTRDFLQDQGNTVPKKSKFPPAITKADGVTSCLTGLVSSPSPLWRNLNKSSTGRVLSVGNHSCYDVQMAATALSQGSIPQQCFKMQWDCKVRMLTLHCVKTQLPALWTRSHSVAQGGLKFTM